jgi:uncharacterized protein YjbJ (UPF0337 family)
MADMKERAKGVADETVGKAKRVVGNAMNRADIVAEGDAQEAKGDAEKAAACEKAAAKP